MKNTFKPPFFSDIDFRFQSPWDPGSLPTNSEEVTLHAVGILSLYHTFTNGNNYGITLIEEPFWQMRDVL